MHICRMTCSCLHGKLLQQTEWTAVVMASFCWHGKCLLAWQAAVGITWQLLLAQALTDALMSGHLGGAGIDVHWEVYRSGKIYQNKQQRLHVT